MALTDGEHTRFTELQEEMIGLVETTETDQAASAFGKIARVCKNVLSREAATRTNKEVATKLKTSRGARESRKNTNGNGRGNTNSGAA